MPRRLTYAPCADRVRLALIAILSLAAPRTALAEVHPLPPPIDTPSSFSTGFGNWSSQAQPGDSTAVPAPPPVLSYEDAAGDAALDLAVAARGIDLPLIPGGRERTPIRAVDVARQIVRHDLGRGAGARVALLRHGTQDAYRPQGFEVDLEGAALPRLQPLEPSSTLVSTDYRVGIPVTWGIGNWQFKTGYSHISAHLGDEFMLAHPTVTRINYVRDSIMFGVGWYCTPNVRLFAEFDYALGTGGGSDPGEFQFGAEYSPAVPGGAPFAAVYTDLRQEIDYGGYFVVQAGWQIRGGGALHTFRLGVEYLNGMSPQFEFFNQFEQHVGFGLWYDF